MNEDEISIQDQIDLLETEIEARQKRIDELRAKLLQ